MVIIGPELTVAVSLTEVVSLLLRDPSEPPVQFWEGTQKREENTHDFGRDHSLTTGSFKILK